MQTPRELPTHISYPTRSSVWALAYLAALCQLSAPAAEPAPAEKPTLTGEPWKQPAPPCAWKIDIQVIAPPTAAVRPMDPVSISVLRTSQFAQEKTQYRNEQTTEIWHYKGAAYTSILGPENIHRGPDDGQNEAEFPDFKWVTAMQFRGPFVINGESMLVFVDQDEPPAPTTPPAQPAKGTPTPPKTLTPKFPPGPIAGFPLVPGIKVAAVDEKTRLPRYLQIGTEIRKYEYSTPSQADLKIPAYVQTVIDAWAPRKVTPRPLP